ncbi:hypothetical protein [Derxia lacustris]|uniref:hypothetical protein n=1 Tax=Derxia lacustris TaxID=764842 RepID=UPI000A1742DF|nr:hypothetical protein [Derxia lacustris]
MNRSALTRSRRAAPAALAAPLAALLALGLLASPAARAGTLANGSWTPASCGARPEAPALDLKDEKAYNRSVDAVNAYRQAARAYVDCLATEANADLQTITRSARDVQQATRDADARILADVKAAEAKFK